MIGSVEGGASLRVRRSAVLLPELCLVGGVVEGISCFLSFFLYSLGRKHVTLDFLLSCLQLIIDVRGRVSD